MYENLDNTMKTFPTDLCQCGHARSEHRTMTYGRGESCDLCQNCQCDRFTPLPPADPAHVAKPRCAKCNPSRGVKSGRNIICGDCGREVYINVFSEDETGTNLTGGTEGSTQSLAASAVVAQAERTDDLPVKRKEPVPPLNPSPGSAASAPNATPEPSSADDARGHAGAPVELACNYYVHHSCGKSGLVQLPDELLRALNKLSQVLPSTWLYRQADVCEALAELVPPIYIQWTGQTFRRPNQKGGQPCPKNSDSESPESSPTPDSGGKPSICSRCGGKDPKCYICGTAGKLDLEAVARRTVRNYLAYFQVGDHAQECLQVLIAEALQKADAAARDECTKILVQKDEGYVLLAGEHEKARGEVHRMERWQRETLFVESQWSPQSVAEALELMPGTDIRRSILPSIEALKKERDDLCSQLAAKENELQQLEDKYQERNL